LAKVSSLLIVPDGGLSYLPFSALWDPVTSRNLVEDFSITHLPSAAALPAVRSQDVALGGKIPPGTGFAPFPDELAESVREVERFRGALPGSRVFRGRRATEERLREALNDGRIVHVATHGVMNARNPMFSRVLLAGDVRGGPENDGRLEVHELVGQQVASPLVFLSGCDTGSGIAWAPGVAGGQGYAALSQAFLYAGASNVVATLWPVQDKSAAEFTEQYYVALDSLGPGEALAEAQRRMLSRPDQNAPYYWAAYTLTGSGRLVGHPKSANTAPVK
jgi:CHAT domain-containing protein